MSYLISPASILDFSSILKLEKICFDADAWTILDITYIFTAPNTYQIKAIANNKIAGFAAAEIQKREKIGIISTIGVFPNFRKRGIGRLLMTNLEKNLNGYPIQLCVDSKNDEAIRLYRSLGFVQTGFWEKYYVSGKDALIMEKK